MRADAVDESNNTPIDTHSLLLVSYAAARAAEYPVLCMAQRRHPPSHWLDSLAACHCFLAPCRSA